MDEARINEKIKILLVDDDQVDQMAFERFVKEEKLSYNYTIAGTVSEAKAVLSAEQFDVAIFDYMLGDGTAFELMGLQKDLPVIITTGAGDEEIAVKVMKVGAYDYLSKDQERSYLKKLPVTVNNALEHRKAQAQIKMLTEAVMSINDSLYITDLENRMIFVNSAFCKTYGYDEVEIIGQKCEILWGKSNGLKREKTKSIFRHTTDLGWTNEFLDVRKDGSEFPVFLSGSILKDDSGNNLSIIRVTHDITERKRLEEALERLSFLDGLTGIANRRNFDDTFDREWKRALRNGTHISLIMIDIDYFKQYNDLYGHQAGDTCLKKVAQQISRSLKRPADLVARYGGEEFVVLLSDTDVEGAIAFAQLLRHVVEDLEINHENSKVSNNVTVSLGVSSFLPHQDMSSGELLSSADQALYQAKRQGRNRVVVL